MKLARRKFLHLAAGAAAAQNLRPDRLMVGYAADTDRYTCMER